jgi:zinc transport system substrate-binding protein
MKKTAPLTVLFFALILVMVAGCAGQRPEEKQQGKAPGKLKVFTTIYPLYDFTVNIGGDKVDVQNLVPAGAEPHEWEPTPRDLANMGGANVFVYCGAGLEPWIDKALKNLDYSKLIVVDSSKGIELKNANEEEGEQGAGNGSLNNSDAGGLDPHIWLDPINAKQMVNNIKEGLINADPGNREYYEANASRYAAKLDALNNDYLVLEKAPEKYFVTSHAAFGYLAERYGLKQVPIRGLSPEVEPTPARIADIIKTVREQKINYIFFETMVSPKVSQVIASEAGAGVLVLNPLGGLSQEEIDAGKNYLSVMRDNLENLKLALGVKNEP